MDELRNPYRPGAGTPPPTLVARDEILELVHVGVHRALRGRPGKSVVALGLRGVGKTVLLNRFVELGTEAGMASEFLEASESSPFPARVAAQARRALLKLSKSGATRLVTKALGVLKSFSLTVGIVDIKIAPSEVPGLGDSGILEDDLIDVFVAIGEAAAQKGEGFLLAIDEIQNLRPEDLAAVIIAIHRTSQLNLPVVLVGAGLPQLPALAGEAKSYAERLFDFPPVGPLASHEAREALRRPLEEEGVGVTDGALDKMVAGSRGYPYFLQEWGYHVWNEARDTTVLDEDVDRAAPLVEAALDRNFFRIRLDRLTPRERVYLHAMATLGPGPHRSGEIAEAVGVASGDRESGVSPAVASMRSQLIKKGMIYSPSYGFTGFTVPMMDEYLRRLDV